MQCALSKVLGWSNGLKSLTGTLKLGHTTPYLEVGSKLRWSPTQDAIGHWDPGIPFFFEDIMILLVTGILGGGGIPKLVSQTFPILFHPSRLGFRTPRHLVIKQLIRCLLSTPQKNDCPNCPIIGTSDEIWFHGQSPYQRNQNQLRQASCASIFRSCEWRWKKCHP